MNAAITQENQALQHDNKQLNALIKEYEQTLETLMSMSRFHM
jgi:prefoldin subunit 5